MLDRKTEILYEEEGSHMGLKWSRTRVLFTLGRRRGKDKCAH
jgi:hypothetical protein